MSRAALLVLITLPFLIALSVLAAGRLTGNHLYLIFLAAFVITIELDRPYSLRALLRITNIYYLVYLGLSLLVYVGIIHLDKSLNIFDATRRVSVFEFQTLVGFYGSTAHIDAISLFVALVNLLFGRGRERSLIIGIAIVASVASVRFTPFVALGIAFIGVWAIGRVRKAGAVRRAVAVGIALAIVFSAPLAMVAAEIFPTGRLESAINLATNGRLRIWQEMGKVFASAPPLIQVFGSGSTDPYYTIGGWPRVHPGTGEVAPFWTANAHNSYLAFALNHGVAAFVLLALVIAYLMAQMRSWRSQLLTLYVLSVGITNAELFAFFFPIYVVWILRASLPQTGGNPALPAVRNTLRTAESGL